MKLKEIREKYLPYNDVTLKRLVISATVMYLWLIIWALVLKLGRESILIGNYTNLKDMTLTERIMWDILPFNYRGEGLYRTKIIMDTVMNCFVFIPVGVAFGYLFAKKNILRDIAICLGFSLLIETMQLITMLGNSATEDLITNVIGGIIGSLLYRILFIRLSVKNSIRLLSAVNLIFAAVTAFSLITTVGASEIIFKIITRSL